MISVRAGSREGSLALKRSAGMGLRGQDLMGDFLMRSWTSPVVSGVMSDREDLAGGSGERSEMLEFTGRGREESIVLTFLMKKLEKSRATTSGCA